MKSSALLLLLAAAGPGFAEVAVVPERLPLDRYAKLKGDAPFSVATKEDKPEEEKIDWAEPLYLGGASKVIENGIEKDWVYINHKSDPSGAFQLYGAEPNAQGIQIVKLEWHPENPLKTVVTLKKGTEFATLKRDQAAFTAPPVPQSPTASGIRPGQPGASGVRPGQPVPTAIPSAGGAIRPPTTTPPRGPQIPRPGGVVVPAPQPTLPQAAPGTAPAQNSDRRRIRVINSR